MKKYLVAFACILGLSACAQTFAPEYHYWQRFDAPSSLYLSGPKAQQHLEQDIAECVHVIIEMAQLAHVRESEFSTVENLIGNIKVDQADVASATQALPNWDVPRYIQDLRVDHKDFHDFEGCMYSKGWTRVRYVHPDVERRARDTYKRTSDFSVREPIRILDESKGGSRVNVEDDPQGR